MQNKRHIPDLESSELADSSHRSETAEIEIGVCKGFTNSTSTITASAVKKVKILKRV